MRLRLPPDCPHSRFPLGEVRLTASSYCRVGKADIIRAVFRHHHGDWGILEGLDREAMDKALLDGDMVISAFRDCEDAEIWVSTDADRRRTTILVVESG